MYMNIIVDLIEDQKNMTSQVRLEGILKLHIKKIDENKKDAKKILLEINELPPDFDYYEKKKKWYRFA